MVRDSSRMRLSIPHDRAELAGVVHNRTDQLRHRTSELGDQMRHLTPDRMQQGAATAARKMQQRPMPFAIGGALAAGLALGRMARHR